MIDNANRSAVLMDMVETDNREKSDICGWIQLLSIEVAISNSIDKWMSKKWNDHENIWYLRFACSEIKKNVQGLINMSKSQVLQDVPLGSSLISPFAISQYKIYG